MLPLACHMALMGKNGYFASERDPGIHACSCPLVCFEVNNHDGQTPARGEIL